MKKNNLGFTLVELIIVITILSILTTIGFLSFQGYLLDTRNTTRVSTLKNIESALNIYYVQKSQYFEPENSTTLTLSGKTYLKQGNLGQISSTLLSFSEKLVDPLTNELYTYGVNDNKTKFQVMGLMEDSGENSYFNNIKIKYPKSFGNNLGLLLLSGSNIPLQNVTTGSLDLNSNVESKYNLSLKDKLYLLSLKDNSYLALKNNNLYSVYNYLSSYWNMQEYTGTKLKDISLNQNNIQSYLSGGILNSISKYISSDTIEGKSMLFSGDNYFKMPIAGTSLYNSGSLTISTRFKLNSSVPSGQKYSILTNRTSAGKLVYQSYIDDDNKIKFFDGYDYAQEVSVVPGKWYNVIFSYDSSIGGRMRLYVNGEKIQNGQWDGYESHGAFSNIDQSGNIFIGTENDYRGFFNGVIDDLKIFNYQISDELAEILFNY